MSDEAHKRYMQKLWDEMAFADSPPPTDLAIKPKVVTRHLSASARKARRVGARSAVLSGCSADKAMVDGVTDRCDSPVRLDAKQIDSGHHSMDRQAIMSK